MSPFKPQRSDGHHRRTAPAWQAATALLVAAALTLGVVACGGGGGGGGGVEVAATPAAAVTPTAFTQGTITGFGSIMVNGVRFDDSTATVTDDAGTARTAQSLRLGMRVEVDHANVDTSAGTARAAAVRYGSLVLGPVAAVDSAANSLTVLGQVVDVTTSTVFSDSLSAGLSAVATGAVIEVHGLADAATGHISATRVEAAASATSYKLRGTVAGLDAAAKTFNIGATAISYAGLASSAVPTGLANGMALRVQLATARSAGFWVAQSLGAKGGQPADHGNGQSGHVRGKISAFTSASQFTVDGVVVDASHASFPDGSAGLALGVEVEVEGTVSNSVLVASQVSLESRHQADDSHKWQLFGAISALDAATKTFVVRDVTVSYGSATRYVGGTLADLVLGRKVHVTGAVGSTRSQLQAAVVSFE